MKTWIVICVGWTVALAAEWPLEVSVTEPTLVEVRIGPSMWEATRGGERRLTIRDGGGRGVPVLREIMRETRMETVLSSRAAEIEDLQTGEENRLDLTCGVPEDGKAVHGLEVEIPMRDFERRVRVWGLADDGTETLLVEDGLWVDYSRYADVRNTRVTWEDGSFRRFRIVVEEAVEDRTLPGWRQKVRTEADGGTTRETWTRHLARPLRIDGIRALTRDRVAREGAEVVKPLDGVEWKEMEISEEGERVFELNTAYRPVTRLTLEAADPVFSRRVTVQIPAGTATGERWRREVSGRISKIAYRDLQENNNTLNVRDLRVERLRVVVDGEGLRPIQVEDLRASGPQWRLVFLAEPELAYRVEVTDEAESADAAQVRKLLSQGYAPERVSPVSMEVAPAAEEAWRVGDLLKSRGFFVAVLLVVGGVLGAGLYRGVKGLEARQDK